jgi:hypothetical protein
MAMPPAYPPYQQPIVSREGRVSTVWHRFFLSLVSTINLIDVVPPVVPPLTAAAVMGLGYWTPITNGDPLSPEILFDAEGDCVVGWVPTP